MGHGDLTTPGTVHEGLGVPPDASRSARCWGLLMEVGVLHLGIGVLHPEGWGFAPQGLVVCPHGMGFAPQGLGIHPL